MTTESVLDHFISIRRELADGMTNVEFNETSWGHQFSWPGLPNEGYNLSIIGNTPSEDEAVSLKEWLVGDPQRRIATTTNLQGFNADPDRNLALFRYGQQKTKAPFIENLNIRSFSFDNRDIRINHRKMTENLSSFLSETSQDKIEWERCVGGILHMTNGRIWILEDTNENILAAAVFANPGGADNWMLEIMGSDLKNDPNNEYLRLLIASTLETYAKTTCFAYAPQPGWKSEFLVSLNFELTESLQLYH